MQVKINAYKNQQKLQSQFSKVLFIIWKLIKYLLTNNV